MNYQTVIGLEVHVQLKTKSKIFCSCPADFDAPANTNICPVCCGYPGVLPVFNKQALKLGIRVALALSCKINDSIYFERKNYFYPDLPKNYQISQYKMPLGEKGYLELPGGKKIGITRVHLEEDAGKLIHKDNYSLVDLNRTGTPLLEIVSEPDIADTQEAYDYLTYLKLTLQYIEASDCDMEKGSLRCDANISLKLKEAAELGTKVELKNMNSFKGVRDGLEFEEKRQANCLETGEKIFQETRLWDAEKSKTYVMRSKEEAHDYRYFPEPDLPDFKVARELIEEEKKHLGEQPLDKYRRFTAGYKLSGKDADVFVQDSWLGKFFEEACGHFNRPDKIAGWLLGPFLEHVNERGRESIKITPQNFAKIIQLFCEDKLNNLAAKKVIALCINTNDSIEGIINKEGLAQVSDSGGLRGFVDAALAENPKVVEEYLAGKEQAMMFLVGQVMKKSKGKANPKVTREMLEGKIKNLKSDK